MPSKLYVGSVGVSGKTAGDEQMMTASSDLGWLMTSDRMDFTFKKRVDKIDWRKIGKYFGCLARMFC